MCHATQDQAVTRAADAAATPARFWVVRVRMVAAQIAREIPAVIAGAAAVSVMAADRAEISVRDVARRAAPRPSLRRLHHPLRHRRVRRGAKHAVIRHPVWIARAAAVMARAAVKAAAIRTDWQ